eukprot:TRINITY_DN3302_c0_g1_i1.p2 TRINITY_DN3302_c0_g1~~TRINITY_DN3302_c0_g1_i1.p2  ORF type:complete len:120 (+),score=21.88 TRINITY_DN3302_c0_g1_i1:55-360(+)
MGKKNEFTFGHDTEEEAGVRAHCKQVWINNAFMGMGIWGGSGAAGALVLDRVSPTFQAWNWRPKLMIVTCLGVAGFWIHGEKALTRCRHERDGQRLKALYG